MEVLICSKRKPLWKRLFALTDKLLCKKKSRYMSVNSNLFCDFGMAYNAVKKYSASIVILDVKSFPDWRYMAEELEKARRGNKNMSRVRW